MKLREMKREDNPMHGWQAKRKKHDIVIETPKDEEPGFERYSYTITAPDGRTRKASGFATLEDAQMDAQGWIDFEHDLRKPQK